MMEWLSSQSLCRTKSTVLPMSWMLVKCPSCPVKWRKNSQPFARGSTHWEFLKLFCSLK
ncbi:hypothetical protein PGIGA_G00026920 [Pangasianodon gigas]|uniref:Uncharacterized protein n=1 Tax=Pangasianodon gigas TaxID=30993 RepID=A0ACC5WWM5_PANGG|nr:hypothetical protein [Pangasianodon gigas]